MSTIKINVSNVLFSRVQQKVLGLLYRQPDADFYMNEIIRYCDSGTGAVQRELEKLTSAGLLIVKKVGNQKRYQANKTTSFFVELRSIILKTFGLADVLKDALNPMASKITVAFIYGSIAKQEDTANSDIDLMLIGKDLTYVDVFKSLEKAESKLGRKINPTFYSPAGWIHKLNEDNNFVTKVIQQPKIYLIGAEDELAQFGKSDKNRPIKN